MRSTLAALLLLPLCFVSAARTEPARYALDPVHTRVMFTISHAGFSNAIGTVSGSTGELWFDPHDWSRARLSARVPIARIDLGDDAWNKAALARNLLDAQRYPEASFACTRIEPRGPRRAIVFGILTLHGIAREVRLDVTLNAAKRHPLPPFRRTLGFSASTRLSRKAFGIDAWPNMIGDTVELRIEAEATRARSASNASAAGTQPEFEGEGAPFSDHHASPPIAPETGAAGTDSNLMDPIAPSRPNSQEQPNLLLDLLPMPKSPAPAPETPTPPGSAPDSDRSSPRPIQPASANPML